MRVAHLTGAACAAAMSLSCSASLTLFVDASAPGGGSGLSWTDATNDFGFALGLAAASPGPDTIFMRVGTYEAPPGGWYAPGDLTISGGWDASAGGAFTRIEDPKSESDRTILSGALFATGIMVFGSSDFVLELDRVDFFRARGAPALEVGEATARLADCRFRYNEAGAGAAVYIGYDGAVEAERCEFFDNSAIGDGGAVYFFGSDPQNCARGLRLNRCFFRDNVAGGSGGGVFIGSVENGALIGNSVFRFNDAGAVGGAVYVGSVGGSSLFNNTMTRNFASVAGGATHVGPTTPSLFQNNIFYNNESGDSMRPDLHLALPTRSTFWHNMVGEVEASGVESGAGGFNFQRRPRLKEKPLMEPRSKSPAIARGRMDGLPAWVLAADFDGDDRVMETKSSGPAGEKAPAPVLREPWIDIGAQEFQRRRGTLASTTTFEPYGPATQLGP